MGWRPWEVYACTVDEFLEAWDGWTTVHCGEPETLPPPTDDEIAELIEIDAAMQERIREKRNLTVPADAG